MSAIASKKPMEINLRRFFKAGFSDIAAFSFCGIGTRCGSSCHAKICPGVSFRQFHWPILPSGEPGSPLVSLKNLSKNSHLAGSNRGRGNSSPFQL
jgi:hypothetical protein